MSFAFRALGNGAVPSAKNTGPPQVFRQTITDSFIVYSKRRVGGLLVFFHAKFDGTDHWRYFVIAVAGHRCQGVVTWKLSDEDVTVDGSGMVTSGKYANAAWLWFVRGTTTDAAHATFVSECDGQWTTAHQGKGVAKIYARFKLTDDVVEAGMPNITAVIEGRDEILDSRTGTTGYTRNGALIFYDWMALPREEGGFGAYSDEVPDDAWISAQANVCDETINGGPRYALDAVLTTGSAPSEVRDAFVVNLAGSYTYAGGKHLMRPGYWEPVSATLAEDDIAGAIQVSPFLPADAAANQIQGTYVSPADGYQGMPFTTKSIAGSDIKQLDVDLAFTTSLDQANRIATIMLNRASYEKSVVVPMNISALGVMALDTVQVEKPEYGLNNYAWRVGSWGLSSDYSIVMNLQEENEAIYADPVPVTPVTPPTVTSPDPVLTIAQIQTALLNTYPVGLTLTGVDAGSNATIQFSAFTLQYPGKAVAIAAHNLTGKAYSTTYYPYLDVTGPGDAAPTFGASTTYFDSLNSATHPYRINLYQQITTPAAGGAATGGTSNGGSGTQGDPLCVTTDTLILMADGSLKPAGEIARGDEVRTRHEHTLEWGAHTVTAHRIARAQPLFRALIDGKALRGTGGHRIWLDGRWQRLRDIGAPDGHGDVVKMTVADAHTYVSNGILSHNVKPIS